jgi:isoleucyl-tRNA synthetase
MTDARDYSATLFLPQTDFPMRAGLPQKEPEILARWAKLGLYQRLRAAAKGRAKFILHDGPPYANGNIHMGTALNKILKDVVTRAQQMLGNDSNYVPGWDCHGLPIEWKIEEDYRAKGKNKDAVPINEFRAECRAFAEHWLDVQREEFKRLGVVGDWDNPYTTMSFPAEAQIARELMKFAANGTLYRGSKPVMWSVVEQTALAEAEVEYHDYTSDQVWVKFPVRKFDSSVLHSRARTDFRDASDPTLDAEWIEKLRDTSILIWTTTPWTLPGNRAISFSDQIEYGLYRVLDAPDGNWAQRGLKLVLADKLAANVFDTAKVRDAERICDVPALVIGSIVCGHPLSGWSDKYNFDVPLLAGDHVTDDAGTGFVHTAPGHGREDFDIWTANARELEKRGINTTIPYTVDENGAFTEQAPGFTGKRVITDTGAKGDANDAVIKALADAGMIIARGRLKHQYPHSWRSKKPVIFRNTPQWFIAMDKPFALAGPPLPTPSASTSPQRGEVKKEDTLRGRALAAIKATRWVPPQGQNRITGMIVSKPDWVLSRQRAWGVPIALFVREVGDGSVEILKDEAINTRIGDAFEKEGADAWYAAGACERFLGSRANEDWRQVTDILDVWFDSGSTHAFVLEDPKNFPSLAGIRRKASGGPDTVMYLEGSDQHRGWFHSSLLESCGTRGVAPFDVVLTHGFLLDEKGEDKMSKSKGNVISPQDVMRTHGADILRLWVTASDYADDIRFGPEILKSFTEAYRKLRNTLRWMLGNLAHFRPEDRIDPARMPELERLMLHSLTEQDAAVRQALIAFDYKRVFATLIPFMTIDLSAFYFDIRKDALYCDPISSVRRKACLTVLDHQFRCLVTWLAPMLCFTAEEAWLSRYPSPDGSVHLELLPEIPRAWTDEALAAKWEKVRSVRRVVTGALELERAGKRIGSSLEAAPLVFISDPDLFAALVDIDLAEVCITSAATLVEGDGPADAFRLDDVTGVAVVPKLAEGRKCARSWKVLTSVGSDPDYPDISPRDAAAMREWEAVARERDKAAE